MKKTTHIDLVNELTALNKKGNYTQLISECAAGKYHDFKSELQMPKVALHNQLVILALSTKELDKIIMDVSNGVYDESPDYDDAISMRNDIISNSGKDSFLLKSLQLTDEDLRKRFPDRHK